jgi:hypothetical protein
MSVRKSFGFDILTGLFSRNLGRPPSEENIEMAGDMCAVHKPKTVPKFWWGSDS